MHRFIHRCLSQRERELEQIAFEGEPTHGNPYAQGDVLEAEGVDRRTIGRACET
jgi:hypothetical protein